MLNTENEKNTCTKRSTLVDNKRKVVRKRIKIVSIISHVLKYIRERKNYYCYKWNKLTNSEILNVSSKTIKHWNIPITKVRIRAQRWCPEEKLHTQLGSMSKVVSLGKGPKPWVNCLLKRRLMGVRHCDSSEEWPFLRSTWMRCGLQNLAVRQKFKPALQSPDHQPACYRRSLCSLYVL